MKRHENNKQKVKRNENQDSEQEVKINEKMKIKKYEDKKKIIHKNNLKKHFLN